MFLFVDIVRSDWLDADLSHNWAHRSISGAPLAQLVECRTLDRKVPGSNLTRGAVLCP